MIAYFSIGTNEKLWRICSAAAEYAPYRFNRNQIFLCVENKANTFNGISSNASFTNDRVDSKQFSEEASTEAQSKSF